MKPLQELLIPYLSQPVDDNLYSQLETYLALLTKWNGKTNLTSIREPEQMVRRHFGESLMLGQMLPQFQTLLDFGSGAGFPGLPIQMLYPDRKVVLSESQGKKAAFLREAVRTLGLKTDVWGQRVETLPASALFDVVSLRAVDSMQAAISAAELRVAPHGHLAMIVGRESQPPAGWKWVTQRNIPEGGISVVGNRNA